MFPLDVCFSFQMCPFEASLIAKIHLCMYPLEASLFQDLFVYVSIRNFILPRYTYICSLCSLEVSFLQGIFVYISTGNLTSPSSLN